MTLQQDAGSYQVVARDKPSLAMSAKVAMSGKVGHVHQSLELETFPGYDKTLQLSSRTKEKRKLMMLWVNHIQQLERAG